ncbi:hypothetical protein [Streptomyces sp. ISL-100]|uniref:hypothetical protein n=1 Tax=Streptomyces sp. ISL-100 TaxID=2819173 RepID=UPI001BECEED0|nr:hypothetical protein [Streptomyces sp. ISL-100]MBT2400186.1 hypothetical protein [Streptomyces sp. ISL-100]
MVVPQDQRTVAAGRVEDGDFPAVLAAEIQGVPLGAHVLDIESDGGEETEQMRLRESRFIGYRIHGDIPLFGYRDLTRGSVG